METTKLNFFDEIEKIETEEEKRKRIINDCKQNESIKSYWLLIHGGSKQRRSVEKCFKVDYYCGFKYEAQQRKIEKQKKFNDQNIDYLADLLKKLKKIFNKAKKEKDLKQLQYLNKKLWKVCGDQQLKNNNIGKDYYDLKFEVHEELRKLEK